MTHRAHQAQRHRRWTRGLLTTAVVGAGVTASLMGGCGDDPISVPLRSLERSGEMSFVCLGAPGSSPGRRLESCTAEATSDTTTFRDDGGNEIPHLYALVTQTTRGEIAVIDLTSDADSVLDQDPGTPGANFLPVGAQPIDIATTPGGTASFVTVAEIGREGIFVLPSKRIRPNDDAEIERLTSWPGCSLPAAPGDVLILSDPAVDGEIRGHCDSAHGDGEAGSLASEGEGRQKLVVTLPALGGFVVLDAQELLDREDGTYEPCSVERWVPLEVDLPPASAPKLPDPTAACVNQEEVVIEATTTPSPRPAGMSYVEGRLYLADYDAPVIHVVDMPTPCEPLELPPLLPKSIEEPTRSVTTSTVSVTRVPTPDFKRYLYAVDVADGSAMVFDISDDADERTPLLRQDLELHPFQPADRIRFSSPIERIEIINRDQPISHPATGAAPVGTRCSPDPDLQTCKSTSNTCDVETLYRTSSNFDAGAGPLTLRGTFAMVLLTSGQIVIVDIDDYDAACRVPKAFSPIYGCPPPGSTEEGEGGPERKSTGERSCNVVRPHTPRSGLFMLSNDDVGRNQPGLQAYPLLYDKDGTIQPPNDPAAPSTPQLRATLPVENTAAVLEIAVGNRVDEIDEQGLVPDEDGFRHTLAMNLEDPRAHVADQEWSVTFEGALPGFGGRVGDLRLDGQANQLRDENSLFCDNGVRSEQAVRAELAEQGLSESEIDDLAPTLADRVQVMQPIILEDDFYYDTASCSFQECRNTFGTVDNPTLSRDVVISEAYQDHLELADSPAGNKLMECCFPTLVTFDVRGGKQWIVRGSRSGFLHHVVTDPETGVCRPSCDPGLARLNGRAPSTTEELVLDDSPSAFRNPVFRFAITTAPTAEQPRRGDEFRFVTQGAFRTLLVDLATQTIDVQPQDIVFLPGRDQLAVTDGSLEGLLLIGTDTLTIDRQIF